jgi:hypothetical protein
MRVILLCAGTSGAAHKVHSDVRVDLPSAGDTRADNTDHRRMCVDPPSTADSGAAHKVHRRMSVDLRCTGETGADNTDHPRMCVDPPSTADSGAAHKVHRRMRVDLRCTGERGAQDRDHRRMCVDPPPTAGAAGGEGDAGARSGGDGRCYGRFRDLCDCTGDLRFNFSNGHVPHRPSGGDGGIGGSRV